MGEAAACLLPTTHPPQQTADMASLPCAELLALRGPAKVRQELLVGFDPVQMLMAKLQARFAHVASFFADEVGGRAVAFRCRQQFKTLLSSGSLGKLSMTWKSLSCMLFALMAPRDCCASRQQLHLKGITRVAGLSWRCLQSMSTALPLCMPPAYELTAWRLEP